ncbi:hypothetical protein [Burkholderia ambifaria]|uniref:hypothetical protein n=1 Tax=Burkholderia ambifaria TaxID=152480 RepID=UPI0015894042|nr:hypothetical protein [Burkholderia ambifaria]WDR89570.1 hypothetical protein OR986_27610 [Burkholderia ambifaria]WDS02375.1 hypothetical protein OR985_32625 [Burkholderia ambifaria]
MAKLEKIPDGAITMTLIDRAFDSLNVLLKGGTIAVVAYFGYLAIKELAGHQTVAEFVLGYFAGKDGGGSKTPWIGTTILSSGWAIIERWLRHRKVSSMSNRLKWLEERFDNNRTSSGLDEAGRPRGKKRGAS